MKKYHLIQEKEYHEFIVAVNRALSEGWELQGGVAYCFFEPEDKSIPTVDARYLQALVKEA